MVSLKLSLREEHGLKGLERMLRRIVGLTREKITRGWRKVHNEEVHSLYSHNIIREIKLRMM
jgi:hypothetical protein